MVLVRGPKRQTINSSVPESNLLMVIVCRQSREITKEHRKMVKDS